MVDLRTRIEAEILENVEETGVRIGGGSYGEVKVVRYQDKDYAAKYIFKTLTHDRRMFDKWIYECKQSCKIRHENIVETIGVFCKENELTVVLVMEKLLCSLDEFVCVRERGLPGYIKLSFLHDVSKGLQYLHSIGIMHRDLTAKNILLTKKLVAKISDFGQSKVVPYSSIINSGNTPTPGNAIYMPPEALGLVHNDDQIDVVEYTTSIDVYSFGVLIIHIHLLELPQPGGKFASIGGIHVQRTPVEYFCFDIDRSVHEDHCLRPLLNDCLQLEPSKRPTADDLVRRTKELMDSDYSVFKELFNCVAMCSQLEKEKNYVVEQVKEMKKSLEQKDEELRLHDQETRKMKEQWRKYERLRSKTESVINQQASAYSNNTVDSLKQQPDLTSSFAAAAASGTDPEASQGLLQSLSNVLQKTIEQDVYKDRDEMNALWEENMRLKEELQQLKSQLKEANDQRFKSLNNEVETSYNGELFESLRPFVQPPPSTVDCKEDVKRELIDKDVKLKIEGAARCKFSFTHVEGAKAVLLGGKIYMGRATGTILAYHRVNKKWESLPAAPVKNYAMANYDGKLVLVGGMLNNVVSSDVYVLEDDEWIKDRICPLNTPRENAVAVGYNKYLVVMGGVTSKARFFTNILKSVEVYCPVTKKWSPGPDLPRPGFVLQCVVADGHLYHLYPDGWAIRYCSLDKLVRAVGTQSVQGVWHSIEKNVPYTRCSLAVYDNTLLTFAGAGSDGNIYAFCPKGRKWIKVACVGELPAIKNACCLQVGRKELFLCGGDIDMLTQTLQAGYLLSVVGNSTEDLSSSRSSSNEREPMTFPYQSYTTRSSFSEIGVPTR